MNTTAFIAASNSATGSLRIAFPQQQVITWFDALAEGPLYDVESKEGIYQRAECLAARHAIFQLTADVFIARAAAFYRKVLALEKVTLWVGNGANEQLMLRALQSTLVGKHVEIVNVSEYTPCDVVAECSPEVLQPLYDKAVSIDPMTQQLLSEEWQRLLREEAHIWLYQNGRLVGKSFEYCDEALLSVCSSAHFMAASRLIGQVMVQPDQRLGDAFYDFRLRELIKQGKIDANDLRAPLRKLEVKKR